MSGGVEGPGIGLPQDASLHGHHIDWLLHVTAAMITALFVIMCGWMVLSMVRHGRGHQPEHDHGSSKKQVLKASLLSAFIFLMVDDNLWWHSTRDMNTIFWNFDAVEANPETVRIQINAHQWAWDARYAGPDGKFATSDDIVTLNDIFVPVGRPILLQLAAVDVIHSFYLPNFRIKKDAVPGSVNRLWFQATRAGVFEIGCAQHCGTNHYKMKGRLHVLDAEAYRDWSERAAQHAQSAYDPNDVDAHWGWPWERGNE